MIARRIGTVSQEKMEVYVNIGPDLEEIISARALSHCIAPDAGDQVVAMT